MQIPMSSIKGNESEQIQNSFKTASIDPIYAMHFDRKSAMTVLVLQRGIKIRLSNLR